jgi:hypothetical protein
VLSARRMRIILFLPLACTIGCIEGPEPPSVHNLTPRACETAIASDARFVVSVDNADVRALRADPPRFVMQGGDTAIEMDLTVDEFGELTLMPRVALPSDTDLELVLVEPGALSEVYIPERLFPARYTTRDRPSVRGRRAIDGRVFISFSQPLVPESISVQVTQDGSTGSIASHYLDSPGNMVYFDLAGGLEQPTSISFASSLRARTGASFTASAPVVDVIPKYTLPVLDGCEYFD